MVVLRSSLIGFVVLGLVLGLDLPATQAQQCQGTCVKDPKTCIAEGGVMVTPCSETEICCDKNEATKALVGTCGAVKTGKFPYVVFQSPYFPQRIFDNVACSFTFELEENTAGVMLEFDVFDSDGVRMGRQDDACDQDMLFIRGFSKWAPDPLCGEMSGYKIVIDDSKLKNLKNLTLLAVMGSQFYRWSIKITQLQADKCSQLSTLPPAAAAPVAAMAMTAQRLPNGTDIKESERNNSDPPEYEGNAQATKMKYFSVRQMVRRSLAVQELTPLAEPESPASPPVNVPWQASIRVDGAGLAKRNIKVHTSNMTCDLSEGIHRCSGTIISDRELLTSAHCFYRNSKFQSIFPIPSLRVYINDPNNCLPNPSDDVQVFQVESVTVHYNFGRKLLMNDLAIVRLNGTISFNEKVKPVQMANMGDTFEGQDASLSGWVSSQGATRQGKRLVAQLQSTDNAVIENSKTCQTRALQHAMVPKQWLLMYEKYQDMLNSFVCVEKKDKSQAAQVTSAGELGSAVVTTRPNSTEKVAVGIVSLNAVGQFHGRKFVMGEWVDYSQSIPFHRRWIDTARCLIQNSSPSTWLRRTQQQMPPPPQEQVPPMDEAAPALE